MSKFERSAPQTSADNLPLIRASELAQYGFCERAWWLGVVKKIPSQNQVSLTRGCSRHQRHEQWVQSAARWRRVGLMLLGVGGLFLLVSLLWLWLGGG